MRNVLNESVTPCWIVQIIDCVICRYVIRENRITGKRNKWRFVNPIKAFDKFTSLCEEVMA